MPFCEDYPCCGHTPADPCDYSGPTSQDILADPARYHLGCDHNTGYCEYERWDDDDEDEDIHTTPRQEGAMNHIREAQIQHHDNGTATIVCTLPTVEATEVWHTLTAADEQNNELSVQDLRVLEALVRHSLSRLIATDEDYALLEIHQKIQEALESLETHQKIQEALERHGQGEEA